MCITTIILQPLSHSFTQLYSHTNWLVRVWIRVNLKRVLFVYHVFLGGAQELAQLVMYNFLATIRLSLSLDERNVKFVLVVILSNDTHYSDSDIIEKKTIFASD